MQDEINKIVALFFRLNLTMKLYHWTTPSYSRHKSSDEFIEKLLELTDHFVEVFIGRYNVKPMLENVKIETEYLPEDKITEYLVKTRTNLENFDKLFQDSELLNIRDEILALINQTSYLFRLK